MDLALVFFLPPFYFVGLFFSAILISWLTKPRLKTILWTMLFFTGFVINQLSFRFRNEATPNPAGLVGQYIYFTTYMLVVAGVQIVKHRGITLTDRIDP